MFLVQSVVHPFRILVEGARQFGLPGNASMASSHQLIQVQEQFGSTKTGTKGTHGVIKFD